MPSLCYELSFGISSAKIGSDGCKVFYVERKVSNLIYLFQLLFLFLLETIQTAQNAKKATINNMT